MKQSSVKRTTLERNIINLRKLLRQRLVLFARSHRGCPKPRGCGCNTDRAMVLLETCERELFSLELTSYAGDDHGGYEHYESQAGPTPTTGNDDGD